MSLSSGDGESIGGYTLIDRLGSGGMGVVHLGLSASGRQVAIKVVHAQYALDEEFRARFRQEVAAARRVSGAFTAPVVDADPDAELPWMATLYVPGPTLSEAIAEKGPLSGRALRTLALGLVEALRDIHRAGMVHRDLKPSNVLMAEDGPRVIDFGISRAADNEDLTVTGRLIGTPPFMSPEQFAAPKDVTGASDVFSLGSLLVYAATGNRPFDGGSPYLTGYQVMYEAPRLDGVAEPLRSIAARCLDKDPDARPRLAELHDLLRRLPDGASTLAVPEYASAHTVPDFTGGRSPADPTVAPRPAGARGAGGRRVRRILLGVGTVLVVGVAGLTAMHMTADPQPAGDSAAPGSSATGSPVAALPAGWQPWRAELRIAKKGDPLEFLQSGCVPGGSTALYCAGTGSTVTRLDAASGRVVWRHGTNPETSLPIGVRDGRVYTYRNPDPTDRYVTLQLVALDANTGAELWNHPVAESQPARLFSRGILTMDATRTDLVAYDATGRRLWSTPAKSASGNACTPTVLNGAPYALCIPADDPSGGDVGLLRLDPADGTSTEIATLPKGTVPLGVLDGRLLFAVPKLGVGQFGSTDDQRYSALMSVSPSTGTVDRVPLPDLPRGTPTLLEGAIDFVRPGGTVTAVGAADGKRLWQRSTKFENLSAPVYSAKYDALYLADRAGRLLALDPGTGTVRWRTAAIGDPGTTAQTTRAYVSLVKDAIVAAAGDTVFSVRPDRPSVAASSGSNTSGKTPSPATVMPTPAPTEASG
ncbi:protein kinase domain-containing protein [Streptomyces sp. CA-249302]|uniref:protein kinase domain-containing protein n=1 Tax=Streptomyces sp. CA-249302 TaxID=3240058 RepID=UPI003D8E47D5